MAILNEAGSKRLSVKAWGTEQVIPRAELLKEVKGVHGILCTICDKIDKEVLDAAGKNSPLLLLSFKGPQSTCRITGGGSLKILVRQKKRKKKRKTGGIPIGGGRGIL